MRSVAWALAGLLCFGVAMLAIGFAAPGDQTVIIAFGGSATGAALGAGIGLTVVGRP